MRAFVLAGSLLLSLPALACINGMNAEEKKTNEMELLVSKAAQKLDDRDFKGAVKDAKRVFESPNATASVKTQARRVLALGQVHTGELKEAHALLLELLGQKVDDPLLLARLGETEVGLGRFEEARKRLEDLSARMLLPDADAQVALAKARLAGGDTDGAKAAVKAALAQEPEHAGALALKGQLEKGPAAAKKALPTRS